ncbi:MAG: hypothetical protein ABI807_03995, partial [Sporichthyaceae bacterium]
GVIGQVAEAVTPESAPAKPRSGSAYSTGVPTCHAYPGTSDNMACQGDATSEQLRDRIMTRCGLSQGTFTLQSDWWQDGPHSIQFNYAGLAGETMGASIDTKSLRVTYCK